MIPNSAKADAVYLGIGSIATQTVLLRFILSSQIGGELYAAFALGAWILWVGVGAIVGAKKSILNLNISWVAQAAFKLPIAGLVYVYPALFSGVVDPVRFFLLIFPGLALPGFLYGLLFSKLVRGEKTSVIYKYEAIGSLLGGLLATVWILAGAGEYGILIFITFLELSRALRIGIAKKILAAFGIIIAIIAGPTLDKFVSGLRWPHYKVDRVAIGLSGRWESLSGEGQTSIIHNGHSVATIPDRASVEESLLWPFLFRPDLKNILLIGYEGISLRGIAPPDAKFTALIDDNAFLKLNLDSTGDIVITDPLDFHPANNYDAVFVRLPGARNLTDYRKETDLFFKRCKTFLNDRGILYVSVPGDENYISPPLAEYLGAINSTLRNRFADIRLIPGQNIGFVCASYKGILPENIDLRESLQNMKIDSPYFNYPLIVNRLAEFRVDKLEAAIGKANSINKIDRPRSVLSFLRWQGSQFGRSSLFFQLYRPPYIFIALILIFIIYAIIRRMVKVRIRPGLGVMVFGLYGLSLEIAVIYLFSTLFGSLYLHLGLLLALFMAGLAIGAGVGRLKKPLAVILLMIFTGIIVLAVSLFDNSELYLYWARIMLYIAPIFAGAAAGGGFAHFADKYSERDNTGAILYGFDLYGALGAAILTPGLLMTGGIHVYTGWILILSIIVATLTREKE